MLADDERAAECFIFAGVRGEGGKQRGGEELPTYSVLEGAFVTWSSVRSCTMASLPGSVQLQCLTAVHAWH